MCALFVFEPARQNDDDVRLAVWRIDDARVMINLRDGTGFMRNFDCFGLSVGIGRSFNPALLDSVDVYIGQILGNSDD